MITLQAPAKLNLTLEVLAARDDGYHEIRSVFQTVSLCDRLSFEIGESLVFQCALPGWQAEKSLVFRAAHLLKQQAAYPGGALIQVSKQIPLASGLGGDSSDAAVVLRGLNQLWNLKMAPGELVKLAARLGSDISFFLSGGTALVQGRGEFISPLPSLPHSWFVLLVPPVRRPESKTGTLYSYLKPEYFTSGIKTDEMVSLLTRGGPVTSGRLFNVFEKVVYSAFEGLEHYQDMFRQAAKEEVHLAGSGPALYAMLDDRIQAGRVYDSLKLQGLEVYLAESLKSID